MSCFIKKIFEGRVDSQVHEQFVRFGKGEYKGRAIINLWKTSQARLFGSSEYANEFVRFASEFPGRFSGIILSKEDLEFDGKERVGMNYYEVEGIESSEARKIIDKAYCLLLDFEGDEISMKIKKKLPKPGKSGKTKIDDKFCALEADLKYYDKIKNVFFWDVPECRKARAEHSYIINEIVMPPGEKDFEKIRLMAKRKGKLIRKLIIDGSESIKEIGFEA